MLSRIRTRVVLASMAVLYALPVYAETADGGLPQFDASRFPSQLFWLAISFALLYALMAYVALPRVQRTQDKRHETVAADLAAASAANEAAKTMIAQYEKALAEARSKAQAMVSDMVNKAAKEAAAQEAQQHEVIAKRIAEAENKIAAARDAALIEARAQAENLALLIAEKVTGSR